MTRTPRGTSARQLVRALEADGLSFSVYAEVIGIYRRADGRRVVVAYHTLGDTFPIGTLRSMLADTGWTDDDLKCLGLLD